MSELIQVPTLTKEQIALVWLRKGAGDKVFDTPSLRRLPLRYALVDAAGAWATNGYSIHHIPSKAQDLSSLADERGFIRLFDSTPAPTEADKYPDISSVWKIDSAINLFEGELSRFKKVIADLRWGMRAVDNYCCVTLERLSSGSVTLNLTHNEQRRFYSFKPLNNSFTLPPARVEVAFDVFLVQKMLAGLRGKTFTFLKDSNAVYVRDKAGRAAMLMQMKTPDAR